MRIKLTPWGVKTLLLLLLALLLLLVLNTPQASPAW
jgi:hypothetical protein